MKENRTYEAYYTQGEYVTYFDKDFISMGIVEAAVIRAKALELADQEKVKPKEKSGAGINRNRKTITLPKRIWEGAYLTKKQES